MNKPETLKRAGDIQAAPKCAGVRWELESNCVESNVYPEVVDAVIFTLTPRCDTAVETENRIDMDCYFHEQYIRLSSP